MALGEHDNNITRQYLLGQLNEADELALEERLLTEDELYQELQVTKDELAQEYAGGNLTSKERQWLQAHLFASQAGKQSREFAQAFDRYAKTHREPVRERVDFWQRWDALWSRHVTFVRAAAAVAVMLIAYFGFKTLSPSPRPQTTATLTLVNTVSTRSTDAGSVPTVKLKDDVLKLTLQLPQPSSVGTLYRFDLMGEGNLIRTLTTSTQDGESISADFSAKELPRGQYVATLSTIDANGTAQRIPGGYHFKIE